MAIIVMKQEPNKPFIAIVPLPITSFIYGFVCLFVIRKNASLRQGMLCFGKELVNGGELILHRSW